MRQVQHAPQPDTFDLDQHQVVQPPTAAALPAQDVRQLPRWQQSAAVLRLQRQYGNQYVQRVLNPPPPIQRTQDDDDCGCGGTCAACQARAQEEETVQRTPQRGLMGWLQRALPNQTTPPDAETQKHLAAVRSAIQQRNPSEVYMAWLPLDNKLLALLAKPEVWALFEQSHKMGTPVEGLPAIEAAKMRFTNDVRSVALRYLAGNEQALRAELAAIGAGKANMTSAQQSHLGGLLRAAQLIKALRDVRTQLRQIPVGWHEDIQPFAPMFAPSTGLQLGSSAPAPTPFGAPTPETMLREIVTTTLGGTSTPTPQQPSHAPLDSTPKAFHLPTAPFLFNPHDKPTKPPRSADPFPQWELVNRYYQQIGIALTLFVQKYPTLAPMLRQKGALDRFTGTASAADQQQQMTQSLEQVLDNIAETRKALQDRRLDPRELTPVYRQLLDGTVKGASNSDWASPALNWVGQRSVASYESGQFWKGLGLGILGGVAFAVAELASFGTATFFVAAGVGAGASAVQIKDSWDKFSGLQAAANATTSDQTRLADQQQADMAGLGLLLDLTFTTFDVAGLRHAVKAARSAGKAMETAPSAGRAMLQAPPTSATNDVATLLAAAGKKNGGLTDAELAAELSAIRSRKVAAISDGDYVKKVEIGNGHSYKQHKDGHWCRFSVENPANCFPAGPDGLPIPLHMRDLQVQPPAPLRHISEKTTATGDGGKQITLMKAADDSTMAVRFDELLPTVIDAKSLDPATRAQLQAQFDALKLNEAVADFQKIANTRQGEKVSVTSVATLDATGKLTGIEYKVQIHEFVKSGKTPKAKALRHFGATIGVDTSQNSATLLNRSGRIISESASEEGIITKALVGSVPGRLELEKSLHADIRLSGALYDRAHAHGNIIGAESDKGVLYAPKEVNLDYQKDGMEGFIRGIYENSAPGAKIYITTVTKRHKLLPTALGEITYKLELSLPNSNLTSRIFEITLKVELPTTTMQQGGKTMRVVDFGRVATDYKVHTSVDFMAKDWASKLVNAMK